MVRVSISVEWGGRGWATLQSAKGSLRVWCTNLLGMGIGGNGDWAWNIWLNVIRRLGQKSYHAPKRMLNELKKRSKDNGGKSYCTGKGGTHEGVLMGVENIRFGESGKK